jgi:branched-subunit amino acid aminotransferase/4-amino-4-deoxychorismate lyase
VKRASGTALYLYRREARHRILELARVRVEASARINPSSLLAGHKSHNYMEVMMLWRAAQTAGYYDCLRLDTAGYLAEACVSNLFFLKGGCLHTPALETGILPGVIRAEVLRLAAAASIPLDQGHYKPEELADAEAVFLTHSLAGIVPLTAVDGFYEASGASVPEVTLLMERLASAEKSASVKP